MRAIIFARVSSIGDRQNTERQIVDLKKYASSNGYEVEKIFSEKISGAKKNEERKELLSCLNYAKANKIDTILVSELSRIGRNVLEVQETVKHCYDNGINIFFQKENITILDEDGNISPITSVLISCLGMVAQLERENIKFRLNSGRKLAIEKGVKMGRKKGTIKSKEQKKEQYHEVLVLLKKGISVANVEAICKSKGIKASKSTIKRLKKEFNL